MDSQEEKKEVGFFTVINTIFAVFIVIIGLMVLAMGAFIVGLLFIILSCFLFIPQKYLKVAKWLKFVITLVLFFTIVIYAGSQTPQFNPKIVEHNLGEEFIITSGDINFSVSIINTSKETDISVNEQKRTTEGIFLKINGFITNKGIAPASLSFEDGIIDANNREYLHLGYDFGGGLLQPELKKSFYYVFELPKSIVAPKFWIKDSTSIHKILLTINYTKKEITER